MCRVSKLAPESPGRIVPLTERVALSTRHYPARCWRRNGCRCRADSCPARFAATCASSAGRSDRQPSKFSLLVTKSTHSVVSMRNAGRSRRGCNFPPDLPRCRAGPMLRASGPLRRRNRRSIGISLMHLVGGQSWFATVLVTAPPAGTTWQVGDVITFSGAASDAQDGTLPASALTWDVILQHCPSDCHPHTGGRER
jgi:hypothetical protein